MIAFIDSHRDSVSCGLKWGVEPICAVLQFAPSTYRENKNRKPSARSVRDEQLKPLITKVFDDNYRVYGAGKVWEQLLRDDVTVARRTVERLMKTSASKVPDEARRSSLPPNATRLPSAQKTL